MNRLVLSDQDGQVVRAFEWSGEPVQVIRRGDTRRLELVQNTESLKKKKIPFELVGGLTKDELIKKPFLVGELGSLSLIENIEKTMTDEPDSQEDRRVLFFSMGILALFVLSLFSALKNKTEMSPKLEEELKQRVVKIVKNMTPPPKPQAMATDRRVQETQTKVAKSQSIKRMGALSALGSLSNSKQRGGLNLGAAQTSAGPGLGGTQGSGGVQTSLYAKGITSAALGAGGNVQGAGGYGTKGKGGGQAGYGKLALTGSTGVSAMPLGAEAVVAKGLDRDQIAAVINRNQGQIRFCYEQGLQGDATLNGRVAVDFTIGGNGLVKVADIESTSLKSKAVEDCILMRLKTWKFPLPDGGVDVKVSYPFTLRRSGQG